MAHNPDLHVQVYIWEISEDGKIAIVQHGQQHHVLLACDSYNTLHDALARVAEIERKFEAQEEDNIPIEAEAGHE